MNRPALICPTCKSDQVDVLSSGLWDGVDENTGHTTGGLFEFGICKQCGGRCAQYVDGHIFVPSETEWQQKIASREKWRRRAESWPFELEDDKPVA